VGADAVRSAISIRCAIEAGPDDTAIALLAERRRTLLQIEQHLILAFEHGFRCGEKRVTAEVLTVLSRQLDDLEPRLTRHGYSVKNLADQFHAKPAEVRRFCAALLIPNARASYPACHCKPSSSVTDFEHVPSMSSTDQII
jgi:hypothetical protein